MYANMYQPVTVTGYSMVMQVNTAFKKVPDSCPGWCLSVWVFMLFHAVLFNLVSPLNLQPRSYSCIQVKLMCFFVENGGSKC